MRSWHEERDLMLRRWRMGRVSRLAVGPPRQALHGRRSSLESPRRADQASYITRWSASSDPSGAGPKRWVGELSRVG
jgi:hypothetical protein